MRDEEIDAENFSYAGFQIRKRTRKVRIDEAVTGSRPFFADDEYATVVRRRQTVLRFDGCAYSSVGNAIAFGLFSFLGGRAKQAFVSQDTFRGGCQWIVKFTRSARIIYDGRAWGTGRELDDMTVMDLDRDGIYEISVPTTIFYGFGDLSPAQTPLPTIIFKYSAKAGRYLPANRQFAGELLADIEERKHGVRSTGDVVENRDHLGDILGIVLDYIFAGREREAWTFYRSAYKLPDKIRVEREIRAELGRSPVYRFIYNRRRRQSRT
jgi:hypothetical protein